MQARQAVHEVAADCQPRCQPQCGRNGEPVLPSALKSIADLRNGHQLAAVERDNRRDAESDSGGRSRQAGWERPVAVHQVEWSIASKRAHERVILAHKAPRAAEIVNTGAEQRIGARPSIVTKCVDMKVVSAGLSFDEREQRGNDAVASAPVHTARDDKRDSHRRAVTVARVRTERPPLRGSQLP